MSLAPAWRARSGRRRKSYRYYVCGRRYDPDRPCERARMVNAERFEQAVVDEVLDVYGDPDTLAAVYAAWQAGQGDDGEGERAALMADIRRADGEIANLLRLAKLGSQLASVAAELASLEAAQAGRRDRLAELERARASARLAPLPALSGVAGALRSALASGDVEAGRVLLARVCSRIDVNADGSPHLTLRPPAG